LTEALTTFHMFDEDGGGSIDAAEIKNTMRAMGKKVVFLYDEASVCMWLTGIAYNTCRL
jgi:hypothetical protein